MCYAHTALILYEHDFLSTVTYQLIECINGVLL
jgi:hypothetical protein